ncbi:MAG: citrate lyase subunit beta / citryl-CoA lyase [Kribbellaceae bacterium]|nr:citrate lyase subunit beta / citryl-CoA lyase [Kribbellaceae bacterium]
MLTALYVPANRPDRFSKAVAASPDLVVFDLEDAVPAGDKAIARGWAVAWMAAHGGPGSAGLEIRVNSPGSPWIADDLAALAAIPAVRIRLPKVESADDVREVLDLVPTARITALLESPLGLEKAFEVATADRRVVAVALGEADLASSLGVDGSEGLAWARGRLVAASRAAGLGAPMMAVYPHVNDQEGLRRSCLAGRELGFVGRTAIHPNQLPTIISAFTPSASQVGDASALLAAVEEAGVVEGGVIVLPDGRMVDPAMIGRAREIVALMHQIETNQS